MKSILGLYFQFALVFSEADEHFLTFGTFVGNLCIVSTENKMDLHLSTHLKSLLKRSMIDELKLALETIEIHSSLLELIRHENEICVTVYIELKTY